MFTNFQFYLFSPDQLYQYLTLYGVLSCLLLATLGLLFLTSGKYFNDSKTNEDMKEGTG